MPQLPPSLFFTPTEKELQRVARRYGRLLIVERYIDGAVSSLKLSGERWPRSVKVRLRFIHRRGPSTADASDRVLPPLHERPPATRILSPSGLALRFYLIALCKAQIQTRSGTPRNDMHLRAGGDDTGWIDLVAVPVEAQMAGKVAVLPSDKKLRQITTALRSLSAPGVQLVHLPNRGMRSRKYEDFQLLDEGGVRETGDVPPYVIPTTSETTFSLPTGLFSNGWVHLLDDTELAVLMMILAVTQLSTQGEWVKIESSVRLLNYGIGRDAYSSAHKTLEALGLLHVQEDENRHMDGKVKDYGKGGQLRLHSFKIRPEGFNEPAVDVMKELFGQARKHAG
ncbi:hypothetical protein [Spirillospora sp. CA-128828]|uniref:hypothetical protein n=1 Tax=Spirillospora sp. CA-128828 TaxID=3240033 RepID=UPI003D8A6B99